MRKVEKFSTLVEHRMEISATITHAVSGCVITISKRNSLKILLAFGVRCVHIWRNHINLLIFFLCLFAIETCAVLSFQPQALFNLCFLISFLFCAIFCCFLRPLLLVEISIFRKYWKIFWLGLWILRKIVMIKGYKLSSELLDLFLNIRPVEWNFSIVHEC